MQKLSETLQAPYRKLLEYKQRLWVYHVMDKLWNTVRAAIFVALVLFYTHTTRRPEPKTKP